MFVYYLRAFAHKNSMKSNSLKFARVVYFSMVLLQRPEKQLQYLLRR